MLEFLLCCIENVRRSPDTFTCCLVSFQLRLSITEAHITVIVLRFFANLFVESLGHGILRKLSPCKNRGSRPTKVVCITVLTGNRLGENCPLWPAATPSSEL